MKKNFTSAVFQERLATFMEIKGLSNEDLARAAAISAQAVGNYFNVGSIPKLTVLARWSSELGLSADWLLSGIGEMLLNGEVSRIKDNESSNPRQRDALLEMLIIKNQELNEKINKITEENATLKANEKLLLVTIEGKQNKSNVSHVSGAGCAAHSSQGGTE